MLSLADIVRWLGRKALTAALLLLGLVACSVLGTYVPEGWLRLRGAAARAGELQGKVAELADSEAQLSRAESALKAAEASGPTILHPVDWWKHRQATAAAREAVGLARKTRDKLNLEIDGLRKATQGTFDRVFHAIKRWGPAFSLVIGVVLLGPFVWRSIAYFLLAPLARGAPPIQLAPERAPGGASAAAPARSLQLRVPPGETFYFRPGCVQQRRDAATGSKWARFPLSPLVTSAGKLFGLTCVRAESAARSATVVLSNSDPDVYFTVLEMRDHPGFVLHPRHIVGLSGGIGVRTRWQIWRWHALLTGQFRYILFYGTGSLVLQGTGGVVADSGADNPSKIEASAVAGFDSRASYATTRTEQSLAYLFGNVPLMDDQFTGPVIFLREVSPGVRSGNIIHNTLGAIWSVLGKFFGF